jgi:hypothetical protein
MPPRINSPRNTTSKRPADFTGQLKTQLEKDHAEELTARDAEIARVTAVQALEDTQEVDTSLDAVLQGHIDMAEKVEVKSAKVHGVRVNYPIEDMTFGRIILDPGDPENGIAPVIGPLRNMSFEEGKPYTMDREVYEHLDAKGYIWH